jgi:lactoylglutathione lyase
MFQGLRGIVYKVSDIEKAKDWYRKVFDTKPFLDTSLAVLFSVGDSVFALSPATDKTIESNNNIIAYWEVDDVDSEYKRLLQLGATVHTGINVVLNRKRATVIDPFGNVLGIRTTLTDANKRSVGDAAKRAVVEK